MIPIQLLGLEHENFFKKGGARSPSSSHSSPRKTSSGHSHVGGRASPQPATSHLKKSSSAHQSSTLGVRQAPPASSEQRARGEPPVDFQSFKSGFSTGMNFIKRRFSSSDLDGESGEVPTLNSTTPTSQKDTTPTHQQHDGPPPAYANRMDSSAFSLQGLSNKMSSTISAPTSPAKHQQQQQQQSMYSQVQGLTKNLFQAATGATKQHYNKEKCKCLLVIDTHNTDWSKYFRNKKILNDFEVRVEQAEFSEISLSSYSDTGCLVDLNVMRAGTKVNRSFQPDFVLVRQPVRTETQDFRKIIIGLLYGGVPSLNSLHSIYNFLDNPWVFAHLLMIQRRLGRDKFPLIDQCYYPSFREIGTTSRFPLVVKVGRGHKGIGKMKVGGPTEMQDVCSVIGVTNEDCTVEPFVDSKYDIHVQKIGGSYKAFMRKGISGHWKANLGSAMLEQIAMTDRYKLWVDEVCQLFGGLDICSVEAIVGKDGKEVIYEVNDCCMTLLGESQEEDRRLIAELALHKMSHILGVKAALSASTSRSGSMSHASPQNFIKHETPQYQQPAAQQAAQQQRSQAPPAQPAAASRSQSTSQAPSGPPPQAAPPAAPTAAPAIPPNRPVSGAPPSTAPRGPPPPRPTRAPSLNKQTSRDSTSVDKVKSAPQQQAPQQQPPVGQPTAVQQNSAASPGQPGQTDPGQTPPQPGVPGAPGGEDTMSNLRKTFAGIFGDM